MEMTRLGSATVHHLIARLLLEILEKKPIRDITCGIHCLSQEPPRSPMLIEHHSSHVTQSFVLPFHHVPSKSVQTQKLVFKTQVMAKGFKVRVFKF
jgi:hypothetical protein